MCVLCCLFCLRCLFVVLLCLFGVLFVCLYFALLAGCLLRFVLFALYLLFRFLCFAVALLFWNISLFHYRNHGAAYGRVLAGVQVPKADLKAFRLKLDELGYRYWDESDNPVYAAFLG